MATTLPAPSFVATANQRVIAEQLGGSREVFYYLNNFPDSIYTKSPNTHLYALMRAILGEGSINLLAKQNYTARAQIEEMSLDMTALDNFFSSPFGVSRAPNESYTIPTVPVTAQVEQRIRSADSSFFSRAVNYIRGARAGNTPLGIRKVAEAGLGHAADIVENYQYLYDQHSDHPLGLPYYGQTLSTEEFIVLPLPEVSITPVLELTVLGPVASGTIGFGYGQANQPTVLPPGDAVWTPLSPLQSVPIIGTRDDIRTAIEQIVGAYNVNVSGDPGGPYYINFQGSIDVDTLLLLNVYNNLTDGAIIYLRTIYGFLDANQEVVNVTSKDAYTLFSALDHIRPVDSLINLAPNTGVYQRVLWNTIYSSSEYSEALRFVTGNASITWPAGGNFWIVSSQEVQAPRIFKDIYYNYQGWHNINSITSSSNAVTASNGTAVNSSANYALADYPEPLFITSSEEGDATVDTYINRIYPVAYENVPGAPIINYTIQSWVSQPGTGVESLTVDFGMPLAVNYITFDLTQNPLQADIFYDTYDSPTDSNFIPVAPILPYHNQTGTTLSANNVVSIALTFSNSMQQMIYARRFQIQFTRLNGYSGPAEVANLRLGRNVAS